MKILLICIVIILAIVALSFADDVIAAGKCAGLVYTDHPALVAECEHQQSLRQSSNNSYPAPDAYPPPSDYNDFCAWEKMYTQTPDGEWIYIGDPCPAP